MADLVAALVECHLLHARGCGSTLGVWHRIQHNSAEVAEEYLSSISFLSVSTLDCHVSIKPLGLAFRRDLMMDIVRRARRTGVPIQFDSPTEELADVTFGAVEEASGAYDQIGCTLPGRWRRSVGDAEWAVARRLAVRVVKGQWADPDDPERDACAGFLDVINRLAGRARRVAVATHDPALIGLAVARLTAAGTPCEVELLADQPSDAAMAAARRAGAAIRGYVAYGDDLVPYRVSRPSGVVTPPGREMRASSPRLSLQSDAHARA
jgi:proline dehydrogenase